MEIREMKERFISFFSQFDKRLRRIRRDRICVVNHGDHYYLSCVYYGVKYGQCYPA